MNSLKDEKPKKLNNNHFSPYTICNIVCPHSKIPRQKLNDGRTLLHWRHISRMFVVRVFFVFQFDFPLALLHYQLFRSIWNNANDYSFDCLIFCTSSINVLDWHHLNWHWNKPNNLLFGTAPFHFPHWHSLSLYLILSLSLTTLEYCFIELFSPI